jgi:GNAT superfamily N-acetyltransferase
VSGVEAHRADDPSSSEPELSMAGPVVRGTQEVDLRPARPDELVACARIWRASINDYLERLAQPEMPDDLTAVTVLYEHLQRTDPDRFVVATRPDDDEPGGERIVAFVSAVVRPPVWYLAMLFVLPEEQGIGLGRTLLERVLPRREDGLARSTSTDSVQPISNALYARYGIVPRVPLLRLVGWPIRPAAFPPLPDGVTASPIGGTEAVVAALDRETLGYEHPQEHRSLAEGGRRAYLYRTSDGTVVGYGYTSDLGRIGPVAVRDESFLVPIVGHLIGLSSPRGAYALWVPGTAGETVTALLEAGLRLEGFPVLLCWDRPFADLARYLPISPGLL